MSPEISKKTIANAEKFKGFFLEDGGDFVMSQIDDLTGFHENTFSKDPYEHAFNAGMRNVSVLIHKLLEKDLKPLREELEKGKENV